MASKADYEAVAKAIAATRVNQWGEPARYIDQATVDSASRSIAQRFAATNERFSAARFLAACGTESPIPSARRKDFDEQYRKRGLEALAAE